MPTRDSLRKFVVALCGASGAVYCRRLVEVLAGAPDVEVHLACTETGLRVAAHELKVALPNVTRLAEVFAPGAASVHPVRDDFFAPVASGSFGFEAMVVVPCSGGRLGSFAAGTCRDLIDRVAEVALKEGRPLILVHRETPLSRLHLENMLRLNDAGATILPASPAFYHDPSTVMDLVDFVVARICDQLDIDNNLIHRWGT